VKLAIFGLGSIGQRHVKNLLEMGETDLLGCDVRTGDEGFVPDLPIPITSAASMVWDWKPDVVLVCVPPAGHYAMANRAIQAGAHCFIEKPMTTTVLECQHLNFQAKEKGVQLAVGYQLRWQLGELRNTAGKHDLKFVCTQDMKEWPSQYEKDALGEFSHELDASVFVHGPVEAVWAQHRQGLWRIHLRHIYANSAIVLGYESKPSLRLANHELHAWTFNQEENDAAYKHELKMFLMACRGEPMNFQLCSGAEAAHVVRIIEACRESAQEFKVVML
jgi:predicted dehydrogenase